MDTSVDYTRAAERLHHALQVFNVIRQREPQDHSMFQTARKQLETLVAEMEPLGEDPGEAWDSLSTEQRWGYVRLASSLGTAEYELRCLKVKI